MQYVHGSAAEQLEREQLGGTSSRPSLNVLQSPRTSQHAETYLSPLAVTVLKAVAAVGVCVALACVGRIAVITKCFQVTSANSALTTQIDQARATCDELEVQQSIYGNSERVRSISTDVYGMVPAGQVTTVNAQTASEQLGGAAE